MKACMYEGQNLQKMFVLTWFLIPKYKSILIVKQAVLEITHFQNVCMTISKWTATLLAQRLL